MYEELVNYINTNYYGDQLGMRDEVAKFSKKHKIKPNVPKWIYMVDVLWLNLLDIFTSDFSDILEFDYWLKDNVDSFHK